MLNTEYAIKQKLLVEFLDRHELDGVYLQNRNNFAWITCGRDNRIPNTTPVGVTAILATHESRVCLANSIESPRMREEELAGTGIDTITFPWWDAGAAKKEIREIIGKCNIAADVDPIGVGFSPLPADFAELRWSLTDAEIARYRDGAARTSRAIETACRQIKPGMSEHEIAGLLDFQVHAQGCNPVVTLIAADERIERFRHPLPTQHKANRYVMLVSCAEFGGLISCLTRFVHFGPVPAELKKKHQAICNVDAAVNLATKPGRSLGDIFRDLQGFYAENKLENQWHFHHQGGSTGYAGREAIATPDRREIVRNNQAFAWNPSAVGVKSEDTVLCTSGGIEILTAWSKDWPKIIGRAGEQTLPRADILQL